MRTASQLGFSGVMPFFLGLFLLPVVAHAQLKEFVVGEMPRPDVSVVQGNKDFPEDALVLVYSSIRGLNFRSSLDAIDKVSFNPTANRYEILVKPLKQMMFVYHKDFMEVKIETINPNPKDVLYYKVEEKRQEEVSTEPGTLKITTEPSGADIFINGIKASDKTPFTGELSAQMYSLIISKQDFHPFDTLVAVQSGQRVLLDLQLTKQQGQFSITSSPDGAKVFMDGLYKGTTPLQGSLEVGQYEVEVKLKGYNAPKRTIMVKAGDAVPLNFSLRKGNQQRLTVKNAMFFTVETKQQLEKAGIPLRQLQFYNSEEIVLEREISQEELGVDKSRVKIENGKKVEKIIIPDYSIGICELHDSRAMKVSFDKDNIIVFLAERKDGVVTEGSHFKIAAKEWVTTERGNKEGKLDYEGKVFTLVRGLHSRLLIDKSVLNNVDRETAP
jgi:hypothetical protein